MNDLVTDIDAFIANVNAGTCDQLSDVVLRFTAKRAAKKFFWSSKIRHRVFKDIGRERPLDFSKLTYTSDSGQGFQ